MTEEDILTHKIGILQELINKGSNVKKLFLIAIWNVELAIYEAEKRNLINEKFNALFDYNESLASKEEQTSHYVKVANDVLAIAKNGEM